MPRRTFLRKGPLRKAPWKTPSTPQPPMFAAPPRAARGRQPTNVSQQPLNLPFHLRLCRASPRKPPPDRRRSGPRRRPGRAPPRRAPTGYIRARTTRTAHRISRRSGLVPSHAHLLRFAASSMGTPSCETLADNAVSCRHNLAGPSDPRSCGILLPAPKRLQKEPDPVTAEPAP